MSRLFGLVVLLLLMLLLGRLPGGLEEAPLSLLLGFLLLAGFVIGKLGNRFGLPGITGYLLAGVLFGPSVLGMLNQPAVDDLSLINGFALTLIAFNAGGEVDLRSVRRRLRSFATITGCQVLLAFLGVLVGMFLLLGVFPQGLPAAGLSGRLAVAMLFAVIATANSPASTVAVIVETGARGRLSELVLGITILKDILVILGFALILAFARSLLGEAGGEGAHLMTELSWEIFGSIGVGLLVGLGIIGYMQWVGRELPVLIIGVSFLSYYLAELLGLHALLMCMAGGLAIKNLSSLGEPFIRAIEQGSLPIYVLFFAIAGAELNLAVLAGSLGLMLGLVALRAVFISLGTWGGTVLAGEEATVRRNLWQGFYPQSGVTLGMAVVVQQSFGEWGMIFANVVVGALAIHEIAGPVLLRWALIRAGEVREPGARPVARRRATAPQAGQ